MPAPDLHTSGFSTSRATLSGIQIGLVAIAGFDRVPLGGPVLEPPTPLGDVGAVLGVPGLVLDEPEALLRLKAESLGVGHCCVEPRRPSRSIRWAENRVVRYIVKT